MSEERQSPAQGLGELFEGWVEHHVLRGERLDPEELCRHQPELLEPLRERIRKYERLGLLIDPPSELEPGQSLLHYRIVERLGAGGMGEVYVADDVKLGRRVALKVLPPDMAADEERLERFRREARIVAGLNHPNVVTLYSVEEAEGVHFLTMELVEGKTLDAVTPAGGMEPELVLGMATALVDALGAAHRQGVIHRDLKPTNVMIAGEGRVKVLDFGLAKLQRRGALETGEGAGETLTTKAGRVLGTVAYMSPEQARGEELDARADIFSLGVILYELVTGTRPFAGESSAEVLGALLERQPTPPTRLNRRVAPRLERVILKCLEKERQRRYSSDQELRNDLGRLQRGSSPQRHLRRTLGLVASLAVLIAAWIVVTRIGWSGGEEATATVDVAAVAPEPAPLSIAVLPFVDLSPEQDQEYFSAGLAEELRHVLAQSPSLRVSGRISSSQFQATNVVLQTIRKKLNVASVLEGSVRTDGKRMRISARLVKTADGFQLWSASFDRELDDIFAVQEEIARAVLREMEGQLQGEELGAVHSRRGNAEAYRAYLQGRYFADRRGEENLQRAIGYYEEALAIDPDYALAWAGLAEVYWAMTGQADLPVEEGYEKARQAAERALRLDDTVAEAWVALGDVKTQDWDWSGAHEAYQRALELAPHNPTVLSGAARMATVLGRFDRAIALARRAVEIDPLMVAPHRQLGIHYYVARRFEEAERAYEKALELSPGYRAVHRMLGQVYLAQGRPEAALAEMERETEPFYRVYGLALACHARGVGRKRMPRSRCSSSGPPIPPPSRSPRSTPFGARTIAPSSGWSEPGNSAIPVSPSIGNRTSTDSATIRAGRPSSTASASRSDAPRPVWRPPNAFGSRRRRARRFSAWTTGPFLDGLGGS